MSRKHYIALAKILNSSRERLEAGGINPLFVWKEMVKALASEMQADNPAFNATKFYTACGLPSNAVCDA